MSTTHKSAKGSILIIDDNEDVQISAKLLLKRQGYAVLGCTIPEEALQLLSGQQFDAILLDMNFNRGASSGQEGLKWLNEIRAIQPQSAIIMITAYGDIDLAISAIKMGASDFILKPWSNEKLLAVLSSALTHSVQDDLTTAKPVELLGQSPAMERVFTFIDKVATTNANVLILGENGTGKDLVAKAIHKASARSEQRWCKVDMGSITESLFESELFGHVKGAFTDAKTDRTGWFEAANKGTLFMDEIGNLSISMQSKLLNAIQSRQITKVGSTRPIDVDIRLICATNMPITAMVQEDTFRKDLLYRINTVEITLPPLRDRKEDIPLLVEHYLGVFGKKYGKQEVRLDAMAIALLTNYSWPGNVRELQHALERAIILSDNTILEELDFSFQSISSSSLVNVSPSGLSLVELERKTIRDALLRFDGNISHTARELGLTRAALYRRIDKYGL
ncbi:MAG: sigma-54-dependent transcriptional regulator [Bacteroidia bacterium]